MARHILCLACVGVEHVESLGWLEKPSPLKNCGASPHTFTVCGKPIQHSMTSRGLCTNGPHAHSNAGYGIFDTCPNTPSNSLSCRKSRSLQFTFDD